MEEELSELDAVTTIGGLRSFLAGRPGIGDYAGGPGEALEEIDDERAPCDPGTWHDEGLSDESPWSSDSLGQGDYPWPPVLESMGRERLDEDLVDELLDRGLAEYEEVGGPMDWLTIPGSSTTRTSREEQPQK